MRPRVWCWSENSVINAQIYMNCYFRTEASRSPGVIDRKIGSCCKISGFLDTCMCLLKRMLFAHNTQCVHIICNSTTSCSRFMHALREKFGVFQQTFGSILSNR